MWAVLSRYLGEDYLITADLMSSALSLTTSKVESAVSACKLISGAQAKTSCCTEALAYPWLWRTRRALWKTNRPCLRSNGFQSTGRLETVSPLQGCPVNLGSTMKNTSKTTADGAANSNKALKSLKLKVW